MLTNNYYIYIMNNIYYYKCVVVFVDKIYLAAVAAVVPGLGRSHVLQAVEILGSAQALFEASPETLRGLGLFRDVAINNFIKNRPKIVPATLAKVCEAQGIQIISYYDEEYPQSLKEIHDGPLVLYVLGNLPKESYSIGIVGSRMATAYGLKAARFFAQSMVAGGVPVISGGAAGIDSAAHAAALEADGVTVAVLGCGVDVVYPAKNKQLFQGILKRGALVSEYPPGTQPQAKFFPARNRIIVGLSRGIIVCEAAMKSGALITARCAADEHREVYCVPGNIFEPTSMGCHSFIQQGAKLISDPREIFLDREEYFEKLRRGPVMEQQNLFPPAKPKFLPKMEATKDLSQVSAVGKQIYQLLSQGPMSMDSLIEECQISFTEISMELLDLQVAGLVDCDQQQKYFRV